MPERTMIRLMLFWLILAALTAGCAPAPTATSVPPTETPTVTATPVPPTATLVPPSVTPVPTETPLPTRTPTAVPPTPTRTALPTPTPSRAPVPALYEPCAPKLYLYETETSAENVGYMVPGPDKAFEILEARGARVKIRVTTQIGITWERWADKDSGAYCPLGTRPPEMPSIPGGECPRIDLSTLPPGFRASIRYYTYPESSIWEKRYLQGSNMVYILFGRIEGLNNGEMAMVTTQYGSYYSGGESISIPYNQCVVYGAQEIKDGHAGDILNIPYNMVGSYFASGQNRVFVETGTGRVTGMIVQVFK